VLIFERIREELRHKKTVMAAIETGYARAYRTIVDANVTTLLSALALMWFGTGPIRGFAVTLSIGLIINMITAVGVSKMIFDAWSLRRKVNSISI
jgi:preprotein translocase subunit SecD